MIPKTPRYFIVMNKFLTFFSCSIIIFINSVTAAPETHSIEKTHSDITFKIRHLFSKVSGRFTDFQGDISYDGAKADASSVNVTIQTASINTDNADRDKHLKGEDFFDAAKHPVITFKSKSVKKTGENEADVTGDLTMHGVTKEVVLKTKFTGKGKDAWGGFRSGWEASTKVNRQDFGIKYNKMVEGASMLGDEVEITIAAEAILK